MFEKLKHYRDCAYNPSLFTQEEKDSFFCMLTALFVIFIVGIFEVTVFFAKFLKLILEPEIIGFGVAIAFGIFLFTL